MMTLPPDIFYFDFEYNEELEPYFAAYGRLLALAQRFESGCCSLAYIVFRKRNPEIILGGEEALRRSLTDIYKQKLVQHIRIVTGDEEETRSMLDAARGARNRFAHESTLGYEHWIHEREKFPE